METFNLPKHVGIIMDGNGRWATQRGEKRSFGHKAGSDNVERIVEHAYKSGVKVLSLYAFSSENWLRPKEEVNELMRLLKVYLKKFIKKIQKNNIRLTVMGDLSALSKSLQKVIADGTEQTKTNTEFTLNIALNYGGRQEIVKTVNDLVERGVEITEKTISENLYTASLGEPDMIIRTGGEIRLSNFMLFQGAYSELYFVNVLWPDFDEAEFDKAITAYSLRKRRYGGI